MTEGGGSVGKDPGPSEVSGRFGNVAKVIHMKRSVSPSNNLQWHPHMLSLWRKQPVGNAPATQAQQQTPQQPLWLWVTCTPSKGSSERSAYGTTQGKKLRPTQVKCQAKASIQQVVESGIN